MKKQISFVSVFAIATMNFGVAMTVQNNTNNKLYVAAYTMDLAGNLGLTPCSNVTDVSANSGRAGLSILSCNTKRIGFRASLNATSNPTIDVKKTDGTTILKGDRDDSRVDLKSINGSTGNYVVYGAMVH